MNRVPIPDFENTIKKKREFFSTGVLPLDKALGGGVLKGSLIEVYGAESSAKTALAFNIIKEAQKKGKTCVFIDLEHKFNKDYATKIGLDLSRLLLTTPLTGDEGYKLIIALVESDKVPLIIVDSFSCFDPKFMYDNLSGLSKLLHEHKATIIFLNQVRHDLETRSQVTSGGRNLKYHMDLRIKLVNMGTLREDLKIIGHHFSAEVIKCQSSYVAESTAEFDVFLDLGVSWESGLLDLAISNKLVKTHGSWYIILNERVARGRLATIRYLMKNKDKCEELLLRLKGLLCI